MSCFDVSFLLLSKDMKKRRKGRDIWTSIEFKHLSIGEYQILASVCVPISYDKKRVREVGSLENVSKFC